MPAAASTLPTRRMAPGRGEDTLQSRVALFAKVVFAIAVAFLAMRAGIEIFMLELPLDVWATRTYTLAHVGSIVVTGVLWLICRGATLAPRTLDVIEAIAVIATCTGWALMIQPESPGNHGLLAVIATVSLRATLVPSSGTRTFAVTALATVPLLIVQIARVVLTDIPGVPIEARIAQTIGVVLWLASGTAIATLASRVIYGLRRQVAEARELGQYSLVRQLGSGGMGEVWLARHRMLVREAAVKIIRPAAIGTHPGAPDILLRGGARRTRSSSTISGSPTTARCTT